MKVVIYTRSEPTAHPEAGILKPGENEIADDKLADRLIAAGRYTGDFIARDTADSGPSEEATTEKPRRTARTVAKTEERE
jgi:hypothetical protein